MNAETTVDMILLRNDLNELKSDVSNIVKHLGSSATHSVKDMGLEMKDTTDKLMQDMETQGNKTFKAVQHEISTHPTLTASLIVAASLITARLMLKK
jgi:ElaB/YqjD/DUF883 family membrane-anchored ribosome-binding protein